MVDACSLIDKKAVKQYLLLLQNEMCSRFEQIDGKGLFVEDAWQREMGGEGKSRVLRHGIVFEQAGVNFSHVFGNNMPSSATFHRPELAGRRFEAMGISVVVHPYNPYIPTSHANVRFFIAEKEGEEPIWWFGGGMDLTPFYPIEDDCYHWHNNIKSICAPFGSKVYSEHKAWCDRYFYLPHRDETRGIGGIFFDDLNQWGFHRTFSYIKAVGHGYLDGYLPIVKKRASYEYGERERQFQLYRRGRYVEFNLLYDRGTLFGLQSGGRTESILISMPPLARWEYGYQPQLGSDEQRLYSDYLKPRQW